MARFGPGYNLRRALLETFQQHWERQFFYGPTREVSALTLLHEASNLSHRIRSGRFTDSMQVGVLLHPSNDYLASLLACWLVGVPAMPIDPTLAGRELRRVIHAGGISFLLTQTSFRDELTDINDRGGQLEAVYVNSERKLLEEQTGSGGLGPEDVVELLRQTDPSTPRAPALVIPSLGGGCYPVLTHQNILAALNSLDHQTDISAGDIVECQLPLHSLEGILLGICLPMFEGASIAIDASLDESTTARVSVAGPPTIGGCPFVAVRPKGDRPWRGILSNPECGGPFAVLVSEEPYTFAILPGLRAEVRDASGDPVAPGGTGVLHLHGLPIMQGYLGDSESTDAVLTPDNWLSTGIRVLLFGDGTIQFIG